MTTNEAWSGSLEVADATMALFGALTLDHDNPDRGPHVFEAFERIHTNCPGPHEFHSALYSAVRVAGVMLATAGDVTDPDDHWGFAFTDPETGSTDIEKAPRAVRFTARWLVAAMNGDMDTCMDLWFGISVSEEESNSITDQLIPMLVVFLEGAVRQLLESGKPLDPTLLASIGSGR